MKAKARAREGRAIPSKEVVAPQGLASKGLADFSDEYTGLRLSLRVEGLGEVEGRLLKASRYQFKLITNGGVLYVNKAYVISIKLLELAPPARKAATGGGRA